MPFRDLRQYLTYLDERGDLLYIRDEVDPKQEIAAYIRKTSDTGGPALFFEKVKGFDMPVVGGIFGHRRRVLMALESTQNEVQEKFVEALAKPLATKVVSRGVCQDVVLTGAQVDLTRLPIPTFAVGDGGPYITLGMVIADALAILVGKHLGTRLPERAIRVGAALSFVIFGILLLMEGLGQ